MKHTITVSSSDLSRTERFKYLGSTLSASGELRNEIASRINATWTKWRSTTGVLCDQHINERLKSKIYRNVIRPAALYGSECWPTIKDNERHLAVMETKMLRLTSGVTCFDLIRNEDIRDRYGLAPIVKNLRDRRFQWNGHVIRANENSLAKIGLNIEVDGKRSKGRPKQRWLDTLNCTQIRDWIELNGETDHDEPTPLINGTKAKEKEGAWFAKSCGSINAPNSSHCYP